MFTLALVAVLLALFLPLPRWLPLAIIPLGLWPPVADALSVVPWQAPLAILLLFPWWLGPLRFLLKGHAPSRPAFAPYDPAAEPLGDEVNAAVEAYAAALGREGFARVGEGFREEHGLRERLALFDHPEHATMALVTAGETRAGELRLATHQLTFSARFADGRTLLVSNHGEPTFAPPLRGRREEHFPQVRDPARLLRVFERCLERFYPDEAPVRCAHGGDVPAYLSDASARWLEEQSAQGGCWRRDGDVYRPTLRGALRMWRLNFPFLHLERLRIRRRADRLLRELGVAGADPRPVPAAAPNRLLEWNVAACTVTALLVIFGGSHLAKVPGLGWVAGAATNEVSSLLPGRERFEVPDGFAVPADYPGAVRALERLTGEPAVRVLADDHGGTLVPTEGMEVHVDYRSGDALVESAREHFAARGFLLFRRDAYVGPPGLAARVVVWPRMEPYAALRVLQTNGWNHDISTEMVEAWLRVMEREHPFAFTIIGFDEVGGRFERQPTWDEALEIAKRVYAFCPDVVDQGTGTLAVLVDEVLEHRSFYCWWD
jgi:hypothetical protein